MASPSVFSGPFAPADVDLFRCVHCGLCLPHCPTYTELGLETESPRGRLYLIRVLAQGRIQPTRATMGHLDLCLQCRNCEVVCPSGVPYGRVMEDARAGILAAGKAPFVWRLRAFFLREIVARPSRLAFVAAVLRFYRAFGVRSLAERVPVLKDRLLLAPTVTGRPFRGSGVLATPDGPVRARVALLTGCIMPVAFARVHRATVRVLARNGCQVIAPVGQGCCGALHSHNGDRRTAMALARRNIDAFLAAGIDTVVVNSAGCGSALREYGELLATDPDYANRARCFSATVKDIHEFLVELPFQAPSGTVAAEVAYQDPCHLAHVQEVSAAPRQLLASIPGLRLVEMDQADRCCGSAGIYSLSQPEMSLRLLDGKMREVARSGVQIIATANPGCLTQMEAGLRRHRLPGRVAHVVELLDEAYGCLP